MGKAYTPTAKCRLACVAQSACATSAAQKAGDLHCARCWRIMREDLAADQGENQASLLRMERQRKLLEPLAHRVPDAPGVDLMRKTNDDIVGIPHNHHSARWGIPTRSGQGQTGRRLQEKDASRRPLSFNPVGRAASLRPYSPNRLV